jgi:hypothetical protein
MTVVAMLAGAVFGAACGTSSSEPPPIDCGIGCWQPTAEDEAFVAEVCSLVGDCCIAGDAENYDTKNSDAQSCKAQFLNAGLSRDAQLRAMCLAEMQDLKAAAPNCFPEPWNLAGACLRVTYEPSGPQAPGQPCENRADCSGAERSVTLCVSDPSGLSPTSKICLRVASGQEGDEPCLGAVLEDGSLLAGALRGSDATGGTIASGYVCERRKGLYCGPESDRAPEHWNCRPVVEDGGACEANLMCASGECRTKSGSSPSSSNLGTCTRRVPVGQTCEDFTERTICDAAGYCKSVDETSQVCVTKQLPGSNCTFGFECDSDVCGTDGTCSELTATNRLAQTAYCQSL